MRFWGFQLFARSMFEGTAGFVDSANAVFPDFAIWVRMTISANFVFPGISFFRSLCFFRISGNLLFLGFLVSVDLWISRVGNSIDCWACSCLGFLDFASGGRRVFAVCDFDGFCDFRIWGLRVSSRAHLSRVFAVLTFAPTSRRAVADSGYSRCAQ